MYLNKVIEQLRSQCPIFQNAVGGVWDWTDTADISEMKFSQLPVCYVLPDEDEVDGQEMAAADYYQQITPTFYLLVFIGKDKNLKNADYDLLEKIKKDILRALAGFHPCNTYDRIEYNGGGGIESCTRAFICFKLRFRYQEYLRSDTGDENTYIDTIKLPTLQGLNIITQAEGVEAELRINYEKENS